MQPVVRGIQSTARRSPSCESNILALVSRLLKTAEMKASLAILACAACTVGDADNPDLALSSDAVGTNQRAVEATNAFVDKFLDPSSHNLRDSHPSDGTWAMPSDYWKYIQGFDAVLDAVERSQGSEFEIHAQQLFTGWHDRPGQWKRDWFDDENWTALALLHAHRVMKEPNGDYAGLASSIYDDIWTRGATHDSRGRFNGIYESISPGSAYHTKAAVSNFGPAITAARLGHMTEATEIYAWARATLSDESTGQVYDHVDPDGKVVTWQYTYNAGVAIGAALELYWKTRDVRYRDDAYRYADYMVHHLVAPWRGKMILHDGCEAHCETQACDCSTFKGIGYRYLSMLYESKLGATDYPDTTQAMNDVLRASVEALWSARSSQGTFPSDWGGGSRPYSSLGSEVSAVMTLNRAAECGF